MANYAYVENGQIVGIYDILPQNWRNVSNLPVFAVDYPIEFKGLGWRIIQKITPQYDPETQKLGDHYHYIENDDIYENQHVVTLPEPTPPEPASPVNPIDWIRTTDVNYEWERIREVRDQKMSEFDWRYLRYDRQVRLGLTPTDDLNAMDLYMQELADITTQSDPYNIIWPTYDS